LSDFHNWNESKAELTVLGKRCLAIDVDSLSRRLDLLVGVQVAEVLIDNHEANLGKHDAANLQKEKPQASVREIIDSLIKAKAASGLGIITINLDDPESPTVAVSNPIIKKATGSGKSFMFSYWRGVLGILLNKDLVLADSDFDEKNSLLKCRIRERITNDTEF